MICTLVAIVRSVIVISAVGQIEGIVELSGGEELMNGGVKVEFRDGLGVTEGKMLGRVTGTVMFAEEVGMVTDMTVRVLPETVMLLPVGGMITVSVTGGADVMLLEGGGVLSVGRMLVRMTEVSDVGVIWMEIPVKGIEGVGAVEFADDGGIVPLTELVRGNGERGLSELVHDEHRLDVTFRLLVGVTLGGAVVEKFDDGAIEPLTVELVSGNGERGLSELVQLEQMLEVVLRLALGVTLGGLVAEEFKGGTIDALTVELVRGNGERGLSELVQLEQMLEVILRLALGVILGGTVTEILEDGTTEPLTLVCSVELVRGNGERGESELGPGDLVDKEAIELKD
jgi:hypothetical protein